MSAPAEGLLATMARGWSRFWFSPGTALNLALNRIIFFGWIFAFTVGVDFAGWGEIAAETDVFWMPTPFFEALGLRTLPPASIDSLQLIWKISLLTSCLGLASRVSLWTSFVAGFYLFGIPHNFGKVHHNDTLIVLIMAVFALSRATDVLTLDRWLERWWNVRWGSPAPAAGPAPSGEYTWPVRAVWVLMSIVFFAAGFSKVAYSGLDWALSHNLENTIVAHFYSHRPPTRLGLYVAQVGLLCQATAVATLVLELGAPLALVSRRLRWVFPPGLFLMQLAIWILLGVNFFNYFVCYFFWIPWDRIVGKVRRRRSRSNTGTADATRAMASHDVTRRASEAVPG